MEFIAKQSKAVLTPSTPGADALDFGISPALARFSLAILLKSTGTENAGAGADPVSAEILYWFPGEGFKSLVPPLVVALVPGAQTVVTREDAATNVRVALTSGAHVADGGVVVGLSGTRTAE